MRFLVDAQLPPGLARWLASRGYPSDHVSDVGLLHATDAGIEAKALETGAAVWSKDRDFADRARYNPEMQVVWIRLGNISNGPLIATLAPLLEIIVTYLKNGANLLEIGKDQSGYLVVREIPIIEE